MNSRSNSARASGWADKADRRARAIAASPGLSRLESVICWLVAVLAAIMGLGVLKAFAKAGKLIDGALSDQISQALFVTGGALAIFTCVLALVLFWKSAKSGA